MLLANFNGKEHLRHRAVSLRQHGFLVLDTGTYSKRPFTNHCYVNVIVTPYSSRTVLQHTEHKKQLLYFLKTHRISYHHGYGHWTALIWIRWSGLSRVERTGAASVSHTHSWHQSPQNTSGWEWQKFDQKINDWAISHWHLRLRSCIQQEGELFEHRLWNSRQNCLSLTIDYLQC